MEREEQQQQAFHILVVDDEPDLEPLIKQRMRPHIRSGQYSFLFAGDGNEAVDILSKDGRIDMVVTDINMPGMDGLTLLGPDFHHQSGHQVHRRLPPTVTWAISGPP